MYRLRLNGKTYNMSQLAKRWGVSPSTASRVVSRVGVEKAEAFYIECDYSDSEIYKLKRKVILSDGKEYTLISLAKLYKLDVRSLYYAYRVAKDSKDFETRLHKLVSKLNNKTYRLSNGCELTIKELAYLWRVTERGVERYIKIHGIERAEKYYTDKLKRKINMDYKIKLIERGEEDTAGISKERH